jgi:hypothetical protein
LINRILKPHNDTGDNATKTNVSPLEEFMKQQKNETVSKKEPQRSKYSRV